jgi:5-methylcytosine-specific restriction endonuclease McrA
MKQCLMTFGSDVDKQTKVAEKDRDSKNHLVSDYVENVEKQTTHKATRQKRFNIVRELLIPYLIAKDSRRAFNEEERRIAWSLSKDKKCTLCNCEVDWADYQLDHIIPHSKGGKTELKNAQITHKVCNGRKSDKINQTL